MHVRALVSGLLSSVILALVTPNTFGVPLDYHIGSNSTVSVNSGDGLLIAYEIDPQLAGMSFTLNNRQSYTFDFFRIWTDETSVDRDDQTPRPITATLRFSDPLIGTDISGVTLGGSFPYGIIQAGVVRWDRPVSVFAVADRVFSVKLHDAWFNLGLYGLAEGESYGATIQATVTQLSSSAPVVSTPVPDSGGTLILLGSTLLGLAIFTRKKSVPVVR